MATTYVMKGGLFNKTRETDDPAVAAAWNLLGYKVIEERRDETPPQPVNPPGPSGPNVNPSLDQTVNPELNTETSGESDITKDTSLTQGGDTSKKHEQQTGTGTIGNNNATLVVTPSADSSMDLKSQASADNTVSQVLTTSGSSQSTSAQANEQTAVGPTLAVSPVLSIDLADSYVSTTDSSYASTAQGTSWWPLIVATGVCALGYVVLRKTRKNKGGIES